MRHAVALAAQAMPLLVFGAVVTALGVVGAALFGRGDVGPALLAEAVGIALAGRGLLALLPPGGPFGRHGTLTTWALSWWLGTLLAQVFGPGRTAEEALGLPALWVPLAMAAGMSALGALPLRPRHVPAPAPMTPADVLGEWSFGLAGLAVAVCAEDPAAAVAFVLLTRAALDGTDTPPRHSAWTAAVFGFGLLLLDAGPLAPNGGGWAAVALLALGSVVWLRRADRRGAWLACLALLGIAASSSAVVALAPAVALLLATARPARRRLSAPLAIAAAACAGLAWRGDLHWLPGAEDWLLGGQATVPLAALLLALLYLLIVGVRAARLSPTEPLVQDGDPPRALPMRVGKERWVVWALGLAAAIAAPPGMAWVAVALALALPRAELPLYRNASAKF